jgi:putative ABC transport system permease protein
MPEAPLQSLAHRAPRARPSHALTTKIAWRNLAHDRVRFAVTLAGIVFSVVLMGMQLGLLMNFVRTTSVIVDNATADIWIVAKGTQGVDLATPIGERRRFQAMSVPGVARAEPMVLGFAPWARPDGVRQTAIVIGVEPNAELLVPFRLTGGRTARAVLGEPDGAAVDRLYRDRLGVAELGQLVEANGVRLRVVAFTDGIRTFTQSPYVFTSLRKARAVLGAADDHATFVLVRVADGQDPAAVRDAIRARIPDVDALLAKDFARSTQAYWLFTTGAGISLIASAVLGLMVGGAIAAQTLYTSTLERLSEYATLRAIGGPSSYLVRIVLTQAAIAAAIGFAVGIGIVLALAGATRDASATAQVPAWLAASIGAVTLAMCLAASLVSIRRVLKIDPVKVFR